MQASTTIPKIVQNFLATPTGHQLAREWKTGKRMNWRHLHIEGDRNQTLIRFAAYYCTRVRPFLQRETTREVLRVDRQFLYALRHAWPPLTLRELVGVVKRAIWLD